MHYGNQNFKSNPCKLNGFFFVRIEKCVCYEWRSVVINRSEIHVFTTERV